MNPNLKVKYLSTNSSDEDLMPESDADDETWGKFRQEFGSPGSGFVLQLRFDSLVDV